MTGNIKRERERLGLTVEEAAAALGVSPGVLRAWESGELEMRASGLRRMSAVYGCSPDYLLGLVDQRSDGFVGM